MDRTFGTVLLAVFICSGIAYADGRVLSVVSPSADEVKEPAKPAQKGSAKKTAPKTAKKTKKKVAAPAIHGGAPIQPVNGNTSQTAKAAAKTEEVKLEKEAKPAVSLMTPEPGVVLLPKQPASEKITKVEKPVPPGQVYVLFQSKPANAEVVVDGYYAGSTPLELPIKEGNHSLRLIYPGYEEWERKFNAYKGMRVNALLVEKKEAPATP